VSNNVNTFSRHGILYHKIPLKYITSWDIMQDYGHFYLYYAKHRHVKRCIHGGAVAQLYVLFQ